MLQIIRTRLAAAGGRLTFAEFMDLALFHPTLGYYSRPGATIGRRGDFTTSPALDPAFGTTVARQVAEMWERLDRPARFHVVEVGAGGGHLARALLQGLPAGARAAAQYAIVERSPSLRAAQQDALRNLGSQVSWWDTLPAGGLTGVVLSNELFDALPVHRVEQSTAGLQELYVVSQGAGLAEEPAAPSSPRLARVLAAGQVNLRPGHRAEVSLAAGEMIQAMGRSLERGYVLTIDYGDWAANLYGARHPLGTVRCFCRHFAVDNPFERLGQQDITADVDFSYLTAAGQSVGLEPLGLTTQAAFLRTLGLGGQEDALAGAGVVPWLGGGSNEVKQCNTDTVRFLLNPNGMGGAFRVLIQGKAVHGPLSGLTSTG